jgi:hypothetical protein
MYNVNRSIVPATPCDLHLLYGLHAATFGPQRREALRLLCHDTFLTSSMLRNLHHLGEAWLGAQRCHETAEALGDPVLIGLAAYSRSAAATGCGSHRNGLKLAVDAVDGLRPHASRPGGLEVLGTLHLVCADAARRSGKLEDGRAWTAEAADLAHRTGETTSLGLRFGPTNVNIWRISIEMNSGGDPARAAEIARRTDPAAIPAAFRQVYYYTDTARALTQLGGHDRVALRCLLTAERLAPQHVHTSPKAGEAVRVLLEHSRRAASGSELRALCGRMAIT